MAEHQRELFDAHLRQNALVAKDPTAHLTVGEEFGLKREKPAGAVAEMHDGQAVFDRDVQRANDLLDGQRIPGAALDAGIVGADHHLAAGDDAYAADAAGAGRFAIIGHVGGERGEFEKRRRGIEQLFQPLARQHLALAAKPVDVARGPIVRALSCFSRNISARCLLCAKLRRYSADRVLIAD